MADPLTAGTLAGISLGSSAVSGIFGRSSASRAMKFQKQMAKHGVRWRAADLKAAGFNPVLAAGGSAATASGGATAQMQAPDLLGAATAEESQRLTRQQWKVANQAEHTEEARTQHVGAQARLTRAEARIQEIMAEAWENMGAATKQLLIGGQIAGGAGMAIGGAAHAARALRKPPPPKPEPKKLRKKTSSDGKKTRIETYDYR